MRPTGVAKLSPIRFSLERRREQRKQHVGRVGHGCRWQNHDLVDDQVRGQLAYSLAVQ